VNKRGRKKLEISHFLWYTFFSSCKEENGDGVRLAKIELAKPQWVLMTPDHCLSWQNQELFCAFFLLLVAIHHYS
jgi:hypothetical protein